MARTSFVLADRHVVHRLAPMISLGWRWRCAVMLAAIFATAPWATAQGIRISTPRTGVSDSFFERQGVGFGFQLGGPSSTVFGSFNQGSFDSAIPQFGGYDPNADATFGWSTIDDDGSGYSLAFRMGKGNTRTMTSNSPSVVVPNGGIGSIFDGSTRPFVTGLIPIVGEPGVTVEPYTPPYSPPASSGKLWSDVMSPEAERPSKVSTTSGTVNYRNENSSAQRGDLSVAELTAQRAQALGDRQKEIDAFVAEAVAYEEEGKYSSARNSYRKAVKLAEGRQRYDLQVKLESLLSK